MYRYICSICESNCDAGELINGICDECREAEIRKRTKSVQQEQSRNRLVIMPKGQLCLAAEGGSTNG